MRGPKTLFGWSIGLDGIDQALSRLAGTLGDLADLPVAEIDGNRSSWIDEAKARREMMNSAH
ncbi:MULTISPECIES: hypothetical protein [unclassified Rhizobium]|uniref:hypothetical protein n=1 Tax=unclassified Rhizobium TaxID=2613769 RepID=UPI001ADAFAC4|nr:MULTISPECIES: hypothetical protein [unclassified Rhizobium]MBO9099976.1 hypothetical protein [Rhizobium sp. L58/93]QXZ82787.1 hypothetical protein J5287_11925 [Rhizobium sp. K1/93]QXZ89700.1 hypothetical protein J5280_16665 [Rhizobium sp. K15/93]